MKILIDAAPIIALFNRKDNRHNEVLAFFARFKGEFVTTLPVITECMWLSKHIPVQTQNEILSHVAQGYYELEPLTPADFQRIAELNTKYANIPADFADLSLVAISERLNNPRIVTFDQDFDIYRRFRHDPFERIDF